MRINAKQLKDWLKDIDDNACISLSVYSNNHTKEFIIASSFDEKGNSEEKELLVSTDKED